MENVIARLDRDLNLDRFVKKTCFSFNVVARIKLQSFSCRWCYDASISSLSSSCCNWNLIDCHLKLLVTLAERVKMIVLNSAISIAGQHFFRSGEAAIAGYVIPCRELCATWTQAWYNSRGSLQQTADTWCPQWWRTIGQSFILIFFEYCYFRILLLRESV